MKFEIGQVYKERDGSAGITNHFKIIGMAHHVRPEPMDILGRMAPVDIHPHLSTTLTIQWSLDPKPFEISADEFEEKVRADLMLIGTSKEEPKETKPEWSERMQSSKRQHAQQRDKDKKAREEFVKALESI